MSDDARLKQGNYAYLLVGLLVLLLVAPLVTEREQRHAEIIFHAALGTTLIIGVWSLAPERKWFTTGVMLALVSLALNSTALFVHQPFLFYAIIAVQLLFFGLTLVIAFNHVVLTGPVDINKIIGAVCVYLMIGIVWGLFYLIINIAVPGSFSGLVSPSPEKQMSELLYYSFTTLTTLGSAISPRQHIWRGLLLISKRFLGNSTWPSWSQALSAPILRTGITGRRTVNPEDYVQR